MIRDFRRRSFAAILMTLLLATTAGRGASADTGSWTRIHLALVLDISSSMEDEAQALREAALVLVDSFPPGLEVRITVLVFASEYPAEGLPATEVLCDLEIRGAADREDYRACVTEGVQIRQRDKGDDTDISKALAEAREVLLRSSDAARMTLLFTDGKLDVSHDPGYGTNSSGEDRNNLALANLRALLPTLDADRVQVWPVVLGDNEDQIDLDLMNEIADGAAGSEGGVVCAQDLAPVVQRAPSAAELAAALTDLFARAACISPATYSGSVPIPSIATAAVIQVSLEPGEEITFVTPTGLEVPSQSLNNQMDLGGSRVELSSTGSTLSLRIDNPEAGAWQVFSTSRAPVTSRLTFRGNASIQVTLDSTTVHAGEPVLIEGSFVDQGLAVSHEDLTGLNPEFQAATSTGKVIVLTDDGLGGDRIAQDGTYSGLLDTTGCEGQIQVKVTGGSPNFRLQSLPGTRTIICSSEPLPKMVLRGDGQITLDQGTSAPAIVDITSRSFGTIDARVGVELSSTGSDEEGVDIQLTEGGGEFEIPQGTPTRSFVLQVGEGTPPGQYLATLVFEVNLDGEWQRLSEISLRLDVRVPVEPRSFSESISDWIRDHPVFVVVIVLFLLGGAFLAMRRRTQSRWVRGLSAVVFDPRSDRTNDKWISPARPKAEVFAIKIELIGNDITAVAVPPPGTSGEAQIRRGTDKGTAVITFGGDRQTIRLGQAIAFTDQIAIGVNKTGVRVAHVTVPKPGVA